MYTMGEQIGKGSYGVVRLCKHIFSSKTYCLKTVDVRKLDDAEIDSAKKEVEFLLFACFLLTITTALSSYIAL